MLDSTILTVTSDSQFVALIRDQLHDQVGAGSRMIVAATIDEACSLLQTARPRLVVIHWTGESARYGQLDRFLWTNSVLVRPAPVLLIAERYRTDQATTLFRMGVSEYISRTHHSGQLSRIFSAYLPPSQVATAGAAASALKSEQPSNAWSAGESARRTARVV
jgi:DNA-binding NarL/FixJ family response regulator